MIKYPITYKNFDGARITEDFYFHLSAVELLEMEVEDARGMQAVLEEMVRTNDRAKMVRWVKEILLSAYGVRSEDGRRFVKKPELTAEFAQTFAFDALFIELGTDAEKLAKFVNSLIPDDLDDKIKAKQPQDKPIGPPPVPSR
jgi:hypothetical protein